MKPDAIVMGVFTGAPGTPQPGTFLESELIGNIPPGSVQTGQFYPVVQAVTYTIRGIQPRN